MPGRYQKMLLGTLDLESATIEDIMTPRNEIVGIDREVSIEDIITQIKMSPHTQLAVYKKSIDRVVGFLHLKKVLVLVNQDDFDKQTITNWSPSRHLFLKIRLCIPKCSGLKVKKYA